MLHQRRNLLRMEIATATLRLEWAKAQVKCSPTTPALSSFIEASRAEYKALKTELAKLNRLLKLEASKAAVKS